MPAVILHESESLFFQMGKISIWNKRLKIFTLMYFFCKWHLSWVRPLPQSIALNLLRQSGIKLYSKGNSVKWSALSIISMVERYHQCWYYSFFSTYITVDLWGQLERKRRLRWGRRRATKPAREPMHSADCTHMTHWFTRGTSHSSHCYTWCTHERPNKSQPSAHTSGWHVWLETADTMSGITEAEEKCWECKTWTTRLDVETKWCHKSTRGREGLNNH